MRELAAKLDTNTAPPNSEFPTMAFPVTLIIGMLGAVFLIQKSKEN